jgi:redox-sensitive bicupin YhaK (pirin superfamily)
MTAGTGVAHSEFNPAPDEPVHLLQIWILPEARNLPPGYEQKFFSDEERKGRFRLIAARDGRDGSVQIHQDAAVFALTLEAGDEVHHPLEASRYGWLQVARGNISLNQAEMAPGDGAAISGERELKITASGRAEVLLFDLA